MFFFQFRKCLRKFFSSYTRKNTSIFCEIKKMHFHKMNKNLFFDAHKISSKLLNIFCISKTIKFYEAFLKTCKFSKEILKCCIFLKLLWIYFDNITLNSPKSIITQFPNLWKLWKLKKYTHNLSCILKTFVNYEKYVCQRNNSTSDSHLNFFKIVKGC